MAPRRAREPNPAWVNALLLFMSMIVGAAVSYGVVSAQVSGMEKRVEKLEVGLGSVRVSVASAREDLAEIRGGLRHD